MWARHPSRPPVSGEVAEWFNAPVLKTGVRLTPDREFKSHPLRHFRKEKVMTKKAKIEPEWKCICFRFIGRSRRLERFNKIKGELQSFPEVIIDKEKELIQKAYEEMRDAVLADPLYQQTWEGE